MPTTVLPAVQAPMLVRSSAGRMVGIAAYACVVALWAAFLVATALAPDVLHSVWAWFRGLDQPLQVAGGIVMFPWALGLAVFESSWLPALRLSLVAVLAFGTILACAPQSEED